MGEMANLTLSLEQRSVTLHYPGAEGIVFHDAVFVLRNAGDRPADDLSLHVRIAQEQKPLAETRVDLSAFDVAPSLAPGGEARVSLFRIMQKVVPGFGSKVNLFGYKAALNWTYQVSAAPCAAAGGPPVDLQTWQVRWGPSETDTHRVEVEIG